MRTLNDIFHSEFEKLINLKDVKEEFISSNHSEVKKVFGCIFIINFFKNRAETKRYFNSDFNMTFSLLLESSYALLSGQCRSSLLLLRSAQEANYKYVLECERRIMKEHDSSLTFEHLDYRFNETQKKFLEDIGSFVDKKQFNEYYKSIERNLTYYKKLSGIVHSGSANMPVMSVEYFSNLYQDTIIKKDEFFNLFLCVLNEIFLLNFFLMRDSLKHWDYYVLYNTLRISFGDKRAKTLIKIVKGTK
ncbi:hypothetical protein [Solibacillus sp. FSL K6-1126]|uniref:hypothetical protein n=1 Tax=Solibacillus sp. FSL K6-1126 TaxID=2921463 RepID=UPI0030FCF7C6